MKRIILLITLALIILSGCEEQAEEAVEKTVPVKIHKVHKDSIAYYLSVTGTIMADEDVVLYSKVNERVDDIFVKPGNRVENNQKLVVQYNELIKQSVNSAQTALTNAEVQLEQVKQDYERIKLLFDQNAVSPQQYDQSGTQYKTAKLALEQAEVQLKQAKEQLENSIIKSPFNGIVAAVYVENNQMLAAGQPVIQVIKPDVMKAKLKISGADIAKVFEGQKVKAIFPSLPAEEFEGLITNVNRAVDPISKTLQVEVIIKNNDSLLKSGLFGEFYIQTDSRNNSIIIPENALQSRTEVNVDKSTGIQNSVKKYFLFLVENNRAELKEVKTGISDNGRIEITSGLNTGDTIIVVGQNIVKSGQIVKVID